MDGWMNGWMEGNESMKGWEADINKMKRIEHLSLFFRLLCKTIRQDLFPTKVLLARAHKKTKLSPSSVPTKTPVPLDSYLAHNSPTANI